jgi:hypothetical protein
MNHGTCIAFTVPVFYLGSIDRLVAGVSRPLKRAEARQKVNGKSGGHA